MKIFQHLSIKHKLILLVLFVSIVSIVIGFSTIIINDIFELREALVNKTSLDASLVAEYCIVPLEFGNKEDVDEVLQKLQTMPVVTNGWIYDKRGKPGGAYNRDGTTEHPPLPQSDYFSNFEGDFLHIARPIFYKGNKFGLIYLRASTETLSENTFAHRSRL